MLCCLTSGNKGDVAPVSQETIQKTIEGEKTQNTNTHYMCGGGCIRRRQMWSKCLTLLVTKALLVYSWEQEVTSSILHCDFVVTITDDACVQRGWGDYYEGWYQSRWQPVAATLKADPRCVYSPSRDDDAPTDVRMPSTTLQLSLHF